MVLVQHHIKLFSKAQFLNQVPIHQSLLLMMFLFVIELVLNLEIVILKMGNSSQQKKIVFSLINLFFLVYVHGEVYLLLEMLVGLSALVRKNHLIMDHKTITH
jgi:hypothetical protein